MGEPMGLRLVADRWERCEALPIGHTYPGFVGELVFTPLGPVVAYRPAGMAWDVTEHADAIMGVLGEVQP